MTGHGAGGRGAGQRPIRGPTASASQRDASGVGVLRERPELAPARGSLEEHGLWGRHSIPRKRTRMGRATTRMRGEEVTERAAPAYETPYAVATTHSPGRVVSRRRLRRRG